VPLGGGAAFPACRVYQVDGLARPFRRVAPITRTAPTKIAVCGRKVKSDFTFRPQTAIF